MLNLMTLKNIYVWQTPYKPTQKTSESLGKILQIHIIGKGLNSLKYKGFLQISKKKFNNPIEKNPGKGYERIIKTRTSRRTLHMRLRHKEKCSDSLMVKNKGERNNFFNLSK